MKEPATAPQESDIRVTMKPNSKRAITQEKMTKHALRTRMRVSALSLDSPGWMCPL